LITGLPLALVVRNAPVVPGLDPGINRRAMTLLVASCSSRGMASTRQTLLTICVGLTTTFAVLGK
jgi:hypothetical protein